MRRFLPSFAVLFSFTFLAAAQTTSAPQTARQALIEMFFGTAPNHLEKHLPDSTRNVFKKMSGPNGMSAMDQVSMFATMARASGGKFETFDTGPVLLHVEDPRENQKVEITVEGDNLSGDEDQIEVALHMTKDAKEQVLPFVPRLTFTMKTEADIWRLSEISLTLQVPLEDPNFLKSIEQEHTKQAEQMAQMNIRSVVNAENSYHATHGLFACNLTELGKAKRETDVGGKGMNFALINGDLASGKSGGYVFVISGCDGDTYKVVGEPDTPNSGEKAFCSDESGSLRSSADGKATTCLSSGEPVQSTGVSFQSPPDVAVGYAPSGPTQPVASKPSSTTRVRVSPGVMEGMVTSKVEPIYPPLAATAKIQGLVLLRTVIATDGSVRDLHVISGHPLLVQAALDAVKQWKFRPYLLNGKPVEVDSQVSVNFTLK